MVNDWYSGHRCQFEGFKKYVYLRNLIVALFNRKFLRLNKAKVAIQT